MKQVRKSIADKNYKARWIYIGALIVTLYFDSKAQDPFNSPKFWALILISAVLFGYIITSKVETVRSDRKFFQLLIFLGVIYLGGLLTSSFSAYSWRVAIFGESFRRNGILTAFGFFIFFIAAAQFVRLKDVQLILKILYSTGLITSLYALIQVTGNDWIKWSSGNQIISTFGNTNFSGSGMAIFAIIVFGLGIINFKNRFYRSSFFLTFLILVYVILQTNARQAIIILILGLSLFLTLFLYRKNKRLWLLSLSLIGIANVLTILAIFKVGPLQSLIYKSSISVREYYWNAGIEMYRNFPLTGVGPDHYGIYFKEFRDVGYPLTYGWGITSSNAHNVFIQNFATGGTLVGLSYFAIQLLIAYRSLRLIKNTVGVEQSTTTLLFSAWVAYQAQSLISIEFIGISIWGWVLGGTLLGLSITNQDAPPVPNGKSVNLNLPRFSAISVLLFVAVLIVIPLREGEKAIWQQSIQYDPNNQLQVELFKRATSEVLENRFVSTDYKNLAAVRVLTTGDNVRAIEILLDVIRQDPRNLDTLALLVDTYEKTGNFERAIYFRSQISKYDPWNAQNYLGLAQLYKQVGRYSEMTNMVEKILSFAPNDPIASVAIKEFPPIVS
jgi:O-antigen ligase